MNPLALTRDPGSVGAHGSHGDKGKCVSVGIGVIGQQRRNEDLCPAKRVAVDGVAARHGRAVGTGQVVGDPSTQQTYRFLVKFGSCERRHVPGAPMGYSREHHGLIDGTRLDHPVRRISEIIQQQPIDDIRLGHRSAKPCIPKTLGRSARLMALNAVRGEIGTHPMFERKSCVCEESMRKSQLCYLQYNLKFLHLHFNSILFQN